MNETRRVPEVLFLCGPSGSGKSTYGRALEAAGWERLSMDVEFWRLGIVSPFPMEEHDRPETELKARLLDLLAAGLDVVLDFSFWSRAMREDYRVLLATVGIIPTTLYVKVDRETIMKRLRTRRGQHADDMVLSEELAASHFDRFEPPTPEEGPLNVIHPWPPRRGTAAPAPR